MDNSLQTNRNFSKKLLLFNLCDSGNISIRTISRLFDDLPEEYVTNDFYLILGNIPTCKEIVDEYSKTSFQYLSLYALFTAEINLGIIELLRQHFSSANDLVQNWNKIKSLHLQERTLTKISDFLDTAFHLKKNEDIDPLLSSILNVLEENQKPVNFADLYSIVVSKCKETQLSPTMFKGAVASLSDKGLIKITAEGLLLKKQNLREFINININEKKYKILSDYLSGKNIYEIAKEFSVTKQRIYQLLFSFISKLPVFDNENRYFSLLSVYKIEKQFLPYLGYPDYEMVRYVELKYSFHSSLTEIDYIVDKQLVTSDIGRKILNENGLICFGSTIIKKSEIFIQLFNIYIKSQKRKSFSLDLIYKGFYAFCNANYPDISLPKLDIQVFARKLENSGSFIPCGEKVYFVFNIDDFSYEFLDEATSYLSNFYGYGSVGYFFKNHFELCNSVGIENEYQLHAILKTLLSKKFKDKIDFKRMPSIATKGLEKDEFFKTIIEERQPIKLDDFITLLETEYGFNRTSILWNLKTWVYQYLNEKDELVISQEPFDTYEIELVNSITSQREMVSADYFKSQLEKLLPNKVDFFMKPHVLFRLGYNFRTNFVLYKNKYKSYEEAVEGFVDCSEMVVSYEELIRCMPSWVIEGKYSYLQKECLLLRFSDTQFINIKKRIDRNALINFRDELVKNLNSEKIYTISEIQDLPFYRKILDSNSAIKCMFNALGNSVFINLLLGSPTIHFHKENGIYTISSKENVSIKLIIKKLVEEKVKINKIDFYEIMRERYGIDKEFSNSYFLELGLYYNTNTEKIYDSKDSCNEELKEYLEFKEETSDEMD